MSAAHTPGPWEMLEQRSGIWSVCTVYGTEQGWVEIHAPNGSDTDDHHAESSANARLIAAAPELLEALITWMDQYGGVEYEDCPEVVQTRAAIAKATGGAV